MKAHDKKATQNPPPPTGLLAGGKSSSLSTKSLQVSSFHLYGPFLFQFTLLHLFLRFGQPFSELFFFSRFAHIPSVPPRLTSSFTPSCISPPPAHLQHLSFISCFHETFLVFELYLPWGERAADFALCWIQQRHTFLN